MIRSIAIACVVLSCAASARAAEILPRQAADFVQRWLRRNPCPFRQALGNGGVRTVRTVRRQDGRSLFSVVGLEGGGFVVTAGDTALNPVVAFSSGGSPDDVAEGTPLHDLLCADMSARVATAAGKESVAGWSLPSASPLARQASVTGAAPIDDVVVAPLVKSQWSQADFGGRRAFNIYTPNSYPCGCVVTAFLQIMRHWRAPSTAVPQATSSCWQDGVAVTLTMGGGVYDWEAMPLTSADCTQDAQREELGRIAYDFGVASRVNWAEASSTWAELAAAALAERFGYASVRTFRPENAALTAGRNLRDLADCRNAILASLDAGMPVSVGLRGVATADHQALVDGYGFDGNGNVYCHLNFGWAGMLDMWYNLIAGEVGEGEWLYNALDAMTYNIHPSVAGDVISGRVLDAEGRPAANVAVRMRRKGGTAGQATVTGGTGVYSFRFTETGVYQITAEDAARGRAVRAVTVGATGANVVFAQPETPYQIAISSLGRVANRWGENLVLDPSGGGSSGGDLAFTASAASADGYLMAGGVLAGTIAVKMGKADRKTGACKLTATVVLAGRAKKLSYKGTMDADGMATLTCKGGPEMALQFGERDFSGGMGEYRITGMRNLFASKDRAEATAANAILAPWLARPVNIAWRDGTLSLAIAKKGKVKVSGTVGGVKVSVAGQLLVDGTGATVPVLETKKAHVGFLVKLPSAGGAVTVEGLADCRIGLAGTLVADARFQVDGEAALWGMLPGKVLASCLPDGQPVTQQGTKWSVAKAGKVVYVKGTTEVDPAKAAGNPSGLKLTYKAKDGTFKGSFKAYSDVGGRLKATSVTVAGVLVDGTGYGTATIKKLGSVSVTVGR